MKLAIIYESDKRYTFPIKNFEDILSKEQLKKLEIKIKKEIARL